MSVEEILELPVPELAHDHAVLYLWITAPKILEIGPALLAAWDFKAVTNRCWDKQRIGQGYWTRGEHEHLVIAKRGVVPPPPPSVRPRSMIREKRSSKHSQKPASVRDDITRAHPLERKIELFARDDDFKGKPVPRFVESWKPGWDAWGDEIKEKVT
jgi:N6-adenosine-specific RNA methylase IME4